jgi:hypothetical protein
VYSKAGGSNQGEKIGLGRVFNQVFLELLERKT